MTDISNFEIIQKNRDFSGNFCQRGQSNSAISKSKKLGFNGKFFEGIQRGGRKFPLRPKRFELCRYKPITAKTNDYYK